MRMMSELNHLFLYAADKKVYVPIDEKDRRRNSAILFLTPNMQTTMHMTMLPYLHNPNLFTSFYIDRNVSAFIDKNAVEEFDEKEAKAVSEAMVHQSNGTKFKMDKVSTMDEKIIRDVYNKDTVKYFAIKLGISNVPDKLNVVIHPSVSALRKSPPKYIKQNCGDDYFSYTDGDTIHILTRMVYDPFSMRGNYEHYLLSELLYALITNFNPNIPYITAMGIAFSFSGIFDYMSKEKNCTINGGKAMEFAVTTVNKIVEKNNIEVVQKYIKTGDLNVFAKYAVRNVLNSVKRALFEGSLSYMERQRLLPSDFGIPDKRDYPIHDEEHVRAAIRMFNHCSIDDEKELAHNIIKKMKKYGIYDIKVSEDNRFHKYYKRAKIINEASKYISLESRDYPDKPMYHNGPSYEWEGQPIVLGEEEYGEYFWDKDNNPVAYYVTKSDPNSHEYEANFITKLVCTDKFDYKSMAQALIARAMDRQNADYAWVKSDSKEYEVLIKSGFKPYETFPDGSVKLTIKESIATDHDPNWEQVQTICKHLSPQELGKITFDDEYKDSEFVIKRYIGRVGGKDDNGNPTMIPAGFLDLYHFPSSPKIAQIVIAVDSRYRGLGVATSMVHALMAEHKDLANQFGFDTLYWTAHPDNEESKYLASRVGRFNDTGKMDHYGRQVFVKYIGDHKPYLDRIVDQNPGNNVADISGEAIVTNEAAFLFEADNSNNSARLKRYLYSERIRTDKDVLLMYKDAKSYNPSILKTYLKLDMYKRLNLFVDLSYYHALFLKNNMLKMDNAVNFYFDFLNKLINNKEIDSRYPLRTIFIPVDAQVWNIHPDTDLTDWRINLNPISIICRLIRTNPGALRKAWGNKNIVFLSDRGYFTVNFAIFEANQLMRFKKNIAKLNGAGPVVDEVDYTDTPTTIRKTPYNGYSIAPDENPNTGDTPKAITARIIDRMETIGGLKIDDMSNQSTSAEDASGNKMSHLKMTSGPFDIPVAKPNHDVIVINLDTSGPDGYEKLSNTVLSDLNNRISAYCMPKK